VKGITMFIATLLCKPGTKALIPSLTQSLMSAWEGRNLNWLAAMEAVEFELLATPNNLWEVWLDMQDLGIDLIVQPKAGRQKKMLLADMDSTMIEQECIDELAKEAGVGARVSDITARAMNGDLEFEQALRERVGLLKGLTKEIIKQVYQKKITFTPGGEVLVATMRAHNGYATLVSGGFTDFTKLVAAKLGFNEHRANILLYANGVLNGQIGAPILGGKEKVTALHEITAAQGLNADDVLAVGDGANDLGMLQSAGIGVALHAKPTVQSQVSVRVNHGDLTALLYLQGYLKSEFVIPHSI
jgi:phosphoserine phosphatase